MDRKGAPRRQNLNVCHPSVQQHKRHHPSIHPSQLHHQLHPSTTPTGCVTAHTYRTNITHPENKYIRNRKRCSAMQKVENLKWSPTRKAGLFCLLACGRVEHPHPTGRSITNHAQSVCLSKSHPGTYEHRFLPTSYVALVRDWCERKRHALTSVCSNQRYVCMYIDSFLASTRVREWWARQRHARTPTS